MSAELRRRFLALPVAKRAPSDLVPSDVYVSTRRMGFQGLSGEQPPSVALGINPYARFIVFCVPIQQRERLHAPELYPRVIEALYGAHVQPPQGEAYRPAVILCDDPVLVEMLMADLSDSGTTASVVQLSTALIDDEIKGASDQTSLLAISDGVFIQMEKTLLSLMQGRALPETSDDAKVAQCGRKFRPDPSVPEIPPIVFHACGNPTCALLKTDAQKCSACRRAWYCSKDCQRAAWRVHKNICKSGGRAPPPPVAPHHNDTVSPS
jgi:hypothetical protein